jgi:hypothetical protein
MGLNAKKVQSNSSNRVEQPVLEPGVYPARLVQLIDLGLQAQRPYLGKDKPPAQEVMLTYELVDAFMVDEDGNEIDDKPRWVSETLPFYGLFADKAKSTQRYNALDPSGAFDGDFSRTVDTPINVTLVTNIVGDKTYTNIANIAAMRPKDAEKCDPLKNPAKVFDLDNPDVEVFNALPDWIQTKIKGNLQFNGSALEKALSGKAPAPAAEAPAPKKSRAPKVEEPNDDNPY